MNKKNSVSSIFLPQINYIDVKYSQSTNFVLLCLPFGRIVYANNSVLSYFKFSSLEEFLEENDNIFTFEEISQNNWYTRYQRLKKINSFSYPSFLKARGKTLEADIMLKLFEHNGIDMVFLYGTPNGLSSDKRPNFMINSIPANLTIISHEIKNPLSTIINFTELLKQEANLSPQQKEYLNIVHDNSNFLHQVIKNFLESSKIQAGKIQISKKVFSLQDLLNKLFRLFSYQCSKKLLYLNIINHVSYDYILSDEQKILQILVNLLGNAVKFTDRGGIEVEVNLLDSTLIFVVKDTGIGIESEDLASLFSPFFQSHQKKSSVGVGLGLFISKYFANKLEGDLTVKSLVGEGTTFRLTMEVELPYQPSSLKSLPESNNCLSTQSKLKEMFENYRHKLSNSFFNQFNKGFLAGDNSLMEEALEEIDDPLLKKELQQIVHSYRPELIQSLIEEQL